MNAQLESNTLDALNFDNRFVRELPSLKFRHPWLQLNLLTAFLAAVVVGLF